MGKETKYSVLTNGNFLEFKHEIMDTKSPSWCAAKWYNATIWLGSGLSTSCHHPPPYKIQTENLLNNPSLIHNTVEKKHDRALMMKGERPEGCQYCWKIEDVGRDNISDRVYKTAIYSQEDLQKAYDMGSEADINLKTLEISFDRTCNFACSYCNPAFSTTWVNDIKRNGAYFSDSGDMTYTHTHDQSQLYKHSEDNPYVQAFFKWWENGLKDSLEELRITGGEPLMSPETWKLLDWLIETKNTTQFALNTNLGAKDEIIEKLIEYSHGVENFRIIYTSNEAVDDQAEYIRDGLNYKQWQKNVERVLSESNIKQVHIMCTISLLSLETLTEFMDWCMEIKHKYRCDDGYIRFMFNLNILRFPVYQGPLLLPDHLKNFFKVKLETWLMKHSDNKYLTKTEEADIVRLIDYLDVVKTPLTYVTDIDKYRTDFKNFFVQYDKRRGKDFESTFPIIGQWYKTIPTTIPTSTENTVIKSITRKPKVIPRNL